MNIITVGIDLAKNVFAVHGVDDSGKPALVKPKVSRADLLPLIANLPPCLIGMEACSGAHHWARLFRQCGHTVKLMAPKFVAPYRMTGKRGKNDAADAAAICEAVTRPAMLFVPVKEEHQQIILCRNSIGGRPRLALSIASFREPYPQYPARQYAERPILTGTPRGALILN